jgi:hypothetical protein
MKSAIAALALGAVITLTIPTAAEAQSSAAPSPAAVATKLTLSSSPVTDSKGRKVPGQLTLTATLTAEGKGLNNRAVDFYQQVDLMGPRDAFIGRALTDSTGVALLRYESAQPGDQVLLAHFAGATGYAKQDASENVTMAEGGTQFKTEPLPLGSVARGLAIATGVIGLAVWALLLGIFFRTVLGIRSAGATEV